MGKPREPVCFQEAPSPPGWRRQGEPPGWQGKEGPMTFITRERLDQHKSISPSGKTAVRTWLTANNTQQGSWATWPLRCCISSSKIP